jgi:hypothetical protein
MTLSQIQSLSKSKFRFLLEPFTLYPDKTYIVTFKVIHPETNSQSYDEIIINSKKGNIIAKFDTNSINIGNYISISPNKKLKISTASYDEDYPTGLFIDPIDNSYTRMLINNEDIYEDLSIQNFQFFIRTYTYIITYIYRICIKFSNYITFF